MKQDALNQLIGLSVIKIEKVHDYIQLEFSNGAILSIFNKYSHSGESLSMLQGKQLLAIEISEDNVLFRFAKEGILSVGMDDTDYNGPEAMVLQKKDEPPFVWN